MRTKRLKLSLTRGISRQAPLLAISRLICVLRALFHDGLLPRRRLFLLQMGHWYFSDHLFRHHRYLARVNASNLKKIELALLKCNLHRPRVLSSDYGSYLEFIIFSQPGHWPEIC